MNRGFLAYFAPALLAVLVLSTNFIDTDFFHAGDLNFAVWFALSVFCFAIGWYMAGVYGWHTGVKHIFSIAVSVASISAVLVLMFGDYFNSGASTVEKIIVYVLRNAFMAAMGVFGLAVSEVSTLDREVYALREKVDLFDETIKDAKKESELVIRDAQIQANKIISEAELSAKSTMMKRERIEKEIKEFIQIEKELIKKYEENS